MTKDEFYQNAQLIKDEWWLSDIDVYPSLLWARLGVFADGKADVVLQDENNTYGFINKESAENFLSEKEFTSIRLMDKDERRDLGIQKKR